MHLSGAVEETLCKMLLSFIIEGKQVRMNSASADEVVAEMKQLYDRGIRNFWFTDAQFIPARKYINDAVELLKKSLMQG